MERWNGRVALVTGSSAGIGYGIAEKLVANGLKVVGLARTEEKLKMLEIKSEKEIGQFIGRKTDVTKKDELIEAFKWTEQNVGPVSLLVNNAGVCVNTKIRECDFDTWKTIIDVNVYALMMGCGLGIKQMTENNIDDGIIININSVGGHKIVNIQGMSHYIATKHAVTAFTEAMRKELAQDNSKIRITSISPGVVKTDMSSQEGFVNQLATCPVIYPEDIAEQIISILANPPHVQITELTIQPRGESY